MNAWTPSNDSTMHIFVWLNNYTCSGNTTLHDTSLYNTSLNHTSSNDTSLYNISLYHTSSNNTSLYSTSLNNTLITYRQIIHLYSSLNITFIQTSQLYYKPNIQF